MANPSPAFSPELYIPPQTRDISFYEKAFNAIIKRTFINEDGSIHVAECCLGDTYFFLHESNHLKKTISPAEAKLTTVTVAIFVEDVDACIQQAVKAGAKLISPAQDYEYGYRQGILQDPFGHQWLIHKRI